VVPRRDDERTLRAERSGDLEKNES